MCGIAGLFHLDGKSADSVQVARMRDALAHRGPDDSGLFSDGPVALGFRRLSILDLEGGHQPMASSDGRYQIVFNGEIYNHPELKAELESSGARYKTRSDTETILHLYAKHGTRALEKLDGMFAIGIWDRQKRELVLARDPVGIKPLYYCVHNQTLFFASELRAMLEAGLSEELDPEAVAEYLAYGRMHAPRTPFKRIKKLRPGELLRANAGCLPSLAKPGEGRAVRRPWAGPAWI